MRTHRDINETREVLRSNFPSSAMVQVEGWHQVSNSPKSKADLTKNYSHFAFGTNMVRKL